MLKQCLLITTTIVFIYYFYNVYTDRMIQYSIIKLNYDLYEPNILKRIFGYVNESPSPVYPLFVINAAFIITLLFVCITLYSIWQTIINT
jgi:hypothetical protein